MNLPEDIGDRLRRARELKAKRLGRKKLPLVEVGKVVGLTHSALSQIENNINTPTRQTLIALAKLYENDFGIPELAKFVQNRYAVEVPLVGRVVAGKPLQMFPDLETIYIPAQMIALNADTFAVQASGDSMRDVGIRDKDIIVLHKVVEFPPNGTVVVARIGFGEAAEYTLKSFYRNGQDVTLMPENDDYDKIMLEKNVTEVQIEGKFAGLIRFGT